MKRASVFPPANEAVSARTDLIIESAPPAASPNPTNGTIAPLLTITDVARLLRTSEKTVRRMITARRIPCLRIGRQIRFLPSDVSGWLAARRED